MMRHFNSTVVSFFFLPSRARSPCGAQCEESERFGKAEKSKFSLKTIELSSV